MSAVVTRPLWRSYKEKFLQNAVDHVRAGGAGVVWRKGVNPKKPVAWMLLPCDKEGDLPELALWAILGIEKDTWEIIPRGRAKGLATMRVPRALEWILEEWCDRDAKWPGNTRDVSFDCTECAACCKDNKVVLDEPDFKRWQDAKRDDLGQKPYIRHKDGLVLLKLVGKDRRCIHLGEGNLCGIYTLRPDNCSVFPMGSEPCLASREEEYGWID